MKTDKKTKYIIAALIGLLFVVTIVHTVAILRMTDEGGQAAQVVKSDGSAKNNLGCLQVTQPLDFVDHFQGINGTNDGATLFTMTYNIKNICTYNVYVVDPSSWTQNNSQLPLQYSTLQTLSGQNSPQWVSTPVDNAYGTNIESEFMYCLTCGMVGTYISNASADGDVNAIGILPSETKTFYYQVEVNRQYGYLQQFLAIYPTIIKWFKQSALNDNNVVSNELLLYTFGSNPLIRSSFSRD